MGIATYANPSGQAPTNPETGVLTYGVITAVAMHVAIAAAILGFAVTPPILSAPPIMVSMITAPSIEPVTPAPRPIPKPQPVTHKPVPVTPAPILASAEKPASPVDAVAPQSPPPVSASTEAAAAAVIPPRFDAAYLDNPAPPYPPLARRMGEQGRVLLHVFVNADGSAGKVDLRTSSGSPRLDQSALDTVRRWRFVPAKLGAQSVTAWVLVPIQFTLGG